MHNIHDVPSHYIFDLVILGCNIIKRVNPWNCTFIIWFILLSNEIKKAPKKYTNQINNINFSFLQFGKPLHHLKIFSYLYIPELNLLIAIIMIKTIIFISFTQMTVITLSSLEWIPFCFGSNPKVWEANQLYKSSL